MLYNNLPLEERTVESLSEKHDIVFVHGIHPMFSPTLNSLLTPNLDWFTKLEVLLLFEPTISASSIKKGNSVSNIWSRQGVILSGGVIQEAFPRDLGTVAKGIKERKSPSTCINHLMNAIKCEKGCYNEFVIEQPKFFGFYICLDKSEEDDNNEKKIALSELRPIKEIIKITKQLNLPIYLIKDGCVYETNHAINSSKISVGKMIPPNKIKESRYILDEEHRQIIREKFFLNSPFKIESIEADYILSWVVGKESYIEINGHNYNQIVLNKTGTIKGDVRRLDGLLNTLNIQKLKKKARLIEEILCFTHDVRYFIIEGYLFKETIGKYNVCELFSRVKRYEELHDSERDNSMQPIYVNNTVINNEAYLITMKKIIDNYLIWHQEAKEDLIRYENLARAYMCAFNLYGFGEQAEKWGDNTTKEQAFALARTVLKEEIYKAMLEKRVGVNGGLRMTQEDLVRLLQIKSKI